MDLLSALHTLRHAGTDLLLHHQGEVLQTLADVGQRLGANNSTATDSLSGNRSIGSGYSGTSLDVVDQTIYHSSSDSESSDVSRHAIRTLVGPALGPRNRNMGEPSRDVSTCKARASEKAAAKMLEGASANISWLLEFSERTPAQIIEERRSRNSDRRIGDIRNVQGQTTAGKEDRLLRSFAQRSLGVDYTCQQRWSRPKTRVDELCESICSSDPEIREHIQRRTNEVKVYVDGLKVSADDRETWQRGINAGVKILVGEELFRRRLEEYGKPMLTDVVAAFTALKGFAFSRLRYEEIPGFIDLILPRNPNDEQASVRVTIEQTEIQCSVADALIALSPWFARFRHTYDEDITSTRHKKDSPPKRVQQDSALTDKDSPLPSPKQILFSMVSSRMPSAQPVNTQVPGHKQKERQGARQNEPRDSTTQSQSAVEDGKSLQCTSSARDDTHVSPAVHQSLPHVTFVNINGTNEFNNNENHLDLEHGLSDGDIQSVTRLTDSSTQRGTDEPPLKRARLNEKGNPQMSSKQAKDYWSSARETSNSTVGGRQQSLQDQTLELSSSMANFERSKSPRSIQLTSRETLNVQNDDRFQHPDPGNMHGPRPPSPGPETSTQDVMRSLPSSAILVPETLIRDSPQVRNSSYGNCERIHTSDRSIYNNPSHVSSPVNSRETHLAPPGRDGNSSALRITQSNYTFPLDSPQNCPGSGILTGISSHEPQNSIQRLRDIPYLLPNGYDPHYDSEHSLQTVHDIPYLCPNGYDPQHGLRPVLADEFSSVLHTPVGETNIPDLASEGCSNQATSRSKSYLQAGYQTQAVGSFGKYNPRGNIYAYGRADIQSLPVS
ncbi:hypothetical protein ASPSYDRAFT_37502 [Aspergillus sydowii CBS 593.65]|uniref:Uncharacterized protein n=1 Tax=Aspergillus sydowii CBS 593.65 TaxID=1036612 RepID=A0A1L9SZ00_9EURO|nr:uncharacterized protein ASPSYDRAFT_37502 [Aspergillus sydowii CBS 593.65]OJJ52301.1 hypothetical protein ASPSYDRAFT_37502 [Aspergillus sydowii CBS 593.65]